VSYVKLREYFENSTMFVMHEVQIQNIATGCTRILKINLNEMKHYGCGHSEVRLIGTTDNQYLQWYAVYIQNVI